MKINTALLLLASFVLLRGCAVVPPPPVQRPPAPAPKPAYVPQPRQPAPAVIPAPIPAPPTPGTRPAAANWRDAPQTPGGWTYSAEPGGSAVRFGQPGAAPLIVIRCDRTRPAVLIQRQSLAAGTLPAAIATSTGNRQLTAKPMAGSPAAQNAPMLFEIAFNTADPLLDSIAFSRGRFMVEISGAPALYLPTWAEIGRVIEDCR
ncbi:MAG: hypothetical protein ACKVOL_12660 [Novosphingobium sp.]